MPPDLLRDAPFGHIVNHLSHGRLFPYLEQRPNYVPQNMKSFFDPSTGLPDSEACMLGKEKWRLDVGGTCPPYTVEWNGVNNPDGPQYVSVKTTLVISGEVAEFDLPLELVQGQEALRRVSHLSTDVLDAPWVGDLFVPIPTYLHDSILVPLHYCRYSLCKRHNGAL